MARDINRIDTFMDELKAFWKQHSDLRFTQLIELIDNNIKTSKQIHDVFYVEDSEFFKYIQILRHDGNAGALKLNKLQDYNSKDTIPNKCFTSTLCTRCYNNPKNGGSGNCTCTLSLPTIT